jgi:hypothetical protein
MRKHLIYWIAPLAITFILILMNYSGIGWMQQFISPAVNREFGFLENLQLLVIIVIGYYAVKAVIKKRTAIERIAFSLIAFASIVVFLEEIDYGLHFYEHFVLGQSENKEIVRNLHNQGNNNFIIRQTLYTMLVLFFLVLPVSKKYIKNKFVLNFVANKMIISTLVTYILVGQFARLLPKLGMPNNPSLWGNHQEFEEVIVYYLFALFLREIVKKKLYLPKLLNF